MTPDQRNALIRQFLMIVGSGAGAYFVKKGWIDQQDATFLAAQGPALLGIAMALGGSIWSAFAHKQVNMVAAVAAMPEVAAVVTASTAEGDKLAAVAPANVVPVDVLTKSVTPKP